MQKGAITKAKEKTMNPHKLLIHALVGKKQVRFQDFKETVEAFGFELEHTIGEHYIYKRNGVQELANLQNYRGEVKPYQLRQFLELIRKYRPRREVKL